jgi:REP element-mobilizing transposase RayT
MKKPKSPRQFSFWKAGVKTHGGALSIGRAKSARPIATKKPMHVILRSSRAKGEWSLLRRSKEIESILERTAKRFHIRVYRSANVGNHIHLFIQARRRADFQNFLRVLPQAIAFLITQARKGNSVGKFWDALAFSRIIEWGRDWRAAVNYVEKNVLEGKGIPRDRVDWWFGLKEKMRQELYT